MLILFFYNCIIFFSLFFFPLFLRRCPCSSFDQFSNLPLSTLLRLSWIGTAQSIRRRYLFFFCFFFATFPDSSLKSVALCSRWAPVLRILFSACLDVFLWKSIQTFDFLTLARHSFVFFSLTQNSDRIRSEIDLSEVFSNNFSRPSNFHWFAVKKEQTCQQLVTKRKATTVAQGRGQPQCLCYHQNHRAVCLQKWTYSLPERDSLIQTLHLHITATTIFITTSHSIRSIIAASLLSLPSFFFVCVFLKNSLKTCLTESGRWILFM